MTVNVFRPGPSTPRCRDAYASRTRQIGAALHERFIAKHESGSLTTPEQSASALLEYLRTGGSGQIWDVA